jgi:hypothetical protein
MAGNPAAPIRTAPGGAGSRAAADWGWGLTAADDGDEAARLDRCVALMPAPQPAAIAAAATEQMAAVGQWVIAVLFMSSLVYE